jgi:hypothetical protein
MEEVPGESAVIADGSSGYDQMPHIVQRAENDIKHHLWSLYWIARMVKAKQIVELGIRRGDSTRALLAACMDLDARLYSVDIEGDKQNVKDLTISYGIRLNFNYWAWDRRDSVVAGEQWSYGTIDLLFIDTTHSFENTSRELYTWNDKVTGAIILHDTGNPDKGRDGTEPAIRHFIKDHSNWRFENHPHVSNTDCGLGILWHDHK